MQWLVIRSQQWPNDNGRSWSSYSYVRSCQRAQHWVFYGRSTFEADSKAEKAWQVGASWADRKLKKKKKLPFWTVIFSYSTQQQWTISLSGCDEWIKVDFIQQPAMKNSVVGPKRSFKALTKAKLAPKKKKKRHGHCLVVHYSFLNQGKTIVSEKYAQQIDEMHWKPQCLKLTLGNRKGPSLLHDNAWAHVTPPLLQKLNKLGLICLAILTWPLANELLLLQSFWQLLSDKMVPQWAGGRNAFQEFTESQSMDFYAIGIIHFSLAKLCWLSWLWFWLINM